MDNRILNNQPINTTENVYNRTAHRQPDVQNRLRNVAPVGKFTRAAVIQQRPLNPEQVSKLESLDNWRWNFQDSEKEWDETFENVQKFVKEYGHFPSSKSKNEDERLLGIWCFNQRKNYNFYKNAGTVKATPVQNITIKERTPDRRNEASETTVSECSSLDERSRNGISVDEVKPETSSA